MEIADINRFLLTRAIQNRITMSFPPRPAMGIQMTPMPPGMMPRYTISPLTPVVPMGVIATPIMPPGMSMIPRHPAQPTIRRPMNNYNRRGGSGHSYSNFRYYKTTDESKEKGPTITVFVGNITEKAPDMMIKHMLQRCGSVANWKRVQGASGKLQAFGFCEYSDAESALRAIRILHDWTIADKKLVVKVDSKTQTQLDEYKASKKKEGSKNDDEIDEDTKRADGTTRSGIGSIMKDYEGDLESASSEVPRRRNRVQNTMLKLAGHNVEAEVVDLEEEEEGEAFDPKDQGIEDMDLEDDKKQIISREIDKFRDCMKKGEEERERDRKEREKLEPGDEHKGRQRDWDRGDNRVRTSDRRKRASSPVERRVRPSSPAVVKSRERSRSRDRSREREREREQRERERERERQREPPDRDRPRTPRDRERSRSRESVRRRDETTAKEKEEEEEEFERRRLERKLRDKEAAYQERLRNWETRERKKAREYEKEKDKEEIKKKEETREAKRLKEFLEDYDDDRDDPKFYKGTALARRLKEREKELEIDTKDRIKEKEELEELRKKLHDEGHPDPSGEVQRIQREQDEKFKPLLKIEQVRVEPKRKPEPPSPVSVAEEEEEMEEDQDRNSSDIGVTNDLEDENTTHSLSEFSDIVTPKEEVKSKPLGFTSLRIGASPQVPADSQQPNTVVNGKRKKLSIGDVFNQDDEDGTDSKGRKKRLATLDDDSIDSATSQTVTPATQEEKRKHIKSLIDKIPTEKEKLFQYTVDWSLVDTHLMDRRIKPWIAKKIVEYIGEEEPSLVDFICSKVMAHSLPPSILEDVKMVLDDEAEVFVVKMWRLLIYEIEAKKLGLGSQGSQRPSKL